MSIVTNDKTCNKIADICKDYFKNNNLGKSTDAKILYTTDMYKDALQYLNLPPIEEIPNGTFLQSPDNIILINYNIFKNDTETLPITIIHELIHFNDYNSFVSEYCNNKWDNVRKHNLYINMYLWSEFHAIYVSLLHGRIVKTLIDKTYSIDEIIEEFQSQYRADLYKKSIESKINITIKDIFNYCAQILLCKEFNKNLDLKEYETNNIRSFYPYFEDLFDTLSKIKTYKDVDFKSLNIDKWI